MKWTGGKEAKQKAIERLKIALEKKILGIVLQKMLSRALKILRNTKGLIADVKMDAQKKICAMAIIINGIALNVLTKLGIIGTRIIHNH